MLQIAIFFMQLQGYLLQFAHRHRRLFLPQVTHCHSEGPHSGSNLRDTRHTNSSYGHYRNSPVVGYLGSYSGPSRYFPFRDASHTNSSYGHYRNSPVCYLPESGPYCSFAVALANRQKVV